MQPLRLLSAHSLLNLESFVTLVFLVSLFARPGKAIAGSPAPRAWPACLAICVGILAVYFRVLKAPFLYDDFTHIDDARRADWRLILSAFGPVEHPPGLFFRPLGFLVYWWNYLLAGPIPFWWHLASLTLHAINCWLVYALGRALLLGADGSLGAAALFALSGAAVEPAAWIDARFDPMATMFVLGSLWSVCRFLDGGQIRWLAGACLAGVAGFLSKESAFCLPLLVACLWFWRPEKRHRVAVAFLSASAVATAVFAYRWWALGGIGGYRGAAGDSNIESFSLVRMLNAVLVRDWTILFFPVNWSGPVGWLLWGMLCLSPVVWGCCVWKTRVPRGALAGAMLMTLFAALPVQHLLLIGVDLANARYVYLLAVGWALVWGVVFAGIEERNWRGAAMGWMVALHLLIGQHNLRFWLDVHEEVRTICTEFGRSLEPSATAIVGGLPQRKNGVVFLANGFPQCVEMNANIAPGRVAVFGTPNFMWNAATGRLEPVRKQ